MNAIKYLLLASLFLCPGNAFAQSVVEDPEAAAIVELGGAAGWDIKGGGSSFGPDFAVEVTPIENWLELEAGTTPLFTRHSTEWDTDLQEALDPLEKSGVHDRRWPGVGSHQELWHHDEFGCR